MNDLHEAGTLTHKGFVNSWECDENDHMNIQFYWKRFAEAARIHYHLTGQKERPWIDRHVRYHRELRMGSNTIVRTLESQDKQFLVHLLFDGLSGQLSATAIDTIDPSGSRSSDSGIDSPIIELAGARSLTGNILDSPAVDDLLQSGKALVTHRSAIQPAECDGSGQLLDQHYIARFSDAASHLWESMGLSRQWLMQRNYGGAAVEMKVSRRRPIRPDMMVQVVSWPFAHGRKTLSFRHQVSDMVSGETLYDGAVTALILDLEARKAVQLPAYIAELMS